MRFRRLVGWVVSCGCGLAGMVAVNGQGTPPRVAYVYPAGACRNTTNQVIIGGQYLGGLTNVYVSGGGVRGTVVEVVKPLTQKQASDLREELKQLEAKRGRGRAPEVKNNSSSSSAVTPTASGSDSHGAWTAADGQRVAEIRALLAAYQRRPTNPTMAEQATIELTVAADAALGPRELRLGSASGITNPLRFHVGLWPEVTEAKSEGREGRFGAELRGGRSGDPGSAGRGEGSAAAQAVSVGEALPRVVNGRILPGEVDRWCFRARKGQHLVAVVLARDLIPYLPDAVPGWFQATLSLRDSQGAELAYVDDDRFRPDPVLDWVVPRDGDYVVEIKDAVYRGREDFVYRIIVGEIPYVTSVFPLGGTLGKEVDIELRGWNLATPRIRVRSGATVRDANLLDLAADVAPLNRLPMDWVPWDAVRETEPNDRMEMPQGVAWPIVVDGRIDRPGDVDAFKIAGKAGERVVAEVKARRLHSPLDSALELVSAGGERLAFNDDCEDPGSGLNTHHADSVLSAVFPADGDYVLRLRDAQSKGGADYAYRLRVTRPEPDFELRVVPSGVMLRPGAHAAITVHALLRDGMTNDIELSLPGAPAGFRLSGGRIPGGETRVRLTLQAPATAPAEPASLLLEGRSQVGGRTLSHRALPAEDMMQAFAYRHLVPAETWMVSVTGRAVNRSALMWSQKTPVLIPCEGTVSARLVLPRRARVPALQVDLVEPPPGISVGKVTQQEEAVEVELRTQAGGLKVGSRGNLLFEVVPERSGSSPASGGAGRARRGRGELLPALPFEIVAHR